MINNNLIGLLSNLLNKDISKENIQDIKKDTDSLVVLLQLLSEISSSTAFFISNSSGIILYANKHFSSIFECDFHDDLIGKNFSIFFEDENINDVNKVLNVTGEGKTWEGVTRHKTSGGKVKCFESKISPVMENGEINYYIGVAGDITNLNLVFSNKNEFDKHLTTLINSTLEAFFLLDEDKHILAFNNAALSDTKKYLHKDLVVLNIIYDYLFFIDRESFDNSFEEALKGNSVRLQNQIKINGQDIWFETAFRPVESEVLSVGISVSYEDISLQKEYESNLKSEKDRFESIINTAPIGILLIDLKNHTIINSNPVAEEILEFDREELIGLKIRNITHSDDVNKEVQKLNKLHTRNIDKLEFNKKVFTKSGKIKYTNNIVSVLDAKTDRTEGLCIFEDITKKYKEQIIKTFLHDLSIAVNTTRDLDELYKMIHRYMSDILDTTNFYIALFDERKNTISFPYLIDVFEDDTVIINASESGSITANVINHRTPLLIKKEEIKRIYGDDDQLGEIPEVWLGAPLTIKNKVIGAIAVQNYEDPDAYDYNDLYLFESVSNQVARALEIKLRESEILQLKAGIDQNTSAVIILDKEFCIEYANLKFYEFNYLKPKDVLGKSFKDYFSNIENCCNLYDKMINAIKIGDFWKSDIRNKNYRGDEIWEAVTAYPIRNENGNIVNYLINKEDITERKLIYKELKLAKDEAEKLSTFKSGVLRNLSHELRTPLNGILGFVQILYNDSQDDEQKEFIKLIQVSGNRLLNTLNSLITLSSLESGEYSIVNNYAFLDEIIEFSLLQFSDIIEEKKLNIIINKKYDKLSVYTDENIVSNIFKEIIDNAIKYSDSEKTIEIVIDKTLYNNKPSLCISIIDQAQGIDKEQLEFIFDAFRQGSEGISRTYEGMGLGLTIAYKMSRLIDAAITIQSEKGKGSTFTICFP